MALGYDRTAEFLQIVGEISGKSPDWPHPAPLVPSDFGNASRPLHASILTTLSFLKSRADDYMNLGRFVTSQASKMSDVERDELEQEISKFGKVCSKKIETLATSIGHDEANPDTVVHQRSVIVFLCSAVKNLGGDILLCSNDICVDELKALKVFRHQRASVRLQPEAKTLAASLDSDTFEASSVSPEELKELQEENKQLHHTLSHEIEAVHAVEKGTMVIISFMTN